MARSTSPFSLPRCRVSAACVRCTTAEEISEREDEDEDGTRKRHLRHTGRGPRREEVEKEAERLTLTEAGDRMTDVDADAVDEDEGAAGSKPGGNG